MFGRDFIKLKTGPLYVLETLFVGWLGAVFIAVHTNEFHFFKRWSMALWVIRLFYLWGLGWILFDCYSAINPVAQLAFQCVFQHALLNIYPVLWMSVGR